MVTDKLAALLAALDKAWEDNGIGCIPDTDAQIAITYAMSEARAALVAALELVASSPALAPVQAEGTYQQRVAAAHGPLFDGDPTDVAERRDRNFEEAAETAQAFGMAEDDAIALVRYTFNRPVGDPTKELGSQILTAFSLAVEAGIDAMAAAEADLAKLCTSETIARIRAKRATRHGRGPLPGLSPATSKGEADE